jgi:hypothetical protein
MKRRSITVCLVTMLASGALAQEGAQPQQILDCTEFSKTTDQAALVKRFGRENVVNAKLDGAEGETIQGTVVFPKDPKRRLEIYWADTAKKRGLGSIAIKDKSEWLVKVPGGARPTVGLLTSIDELEEVNGRPFQISGFGWDMGGNTTGWKGGKLDQKIGGCFFSARFDPDPKAKEKALAKVSGEKDFGSSDAALRAVKPTLSSISLGWPQP